MRIGFSTKVGKRSRVYLAPGGGKRPKSNGSGGSAWLGILYLVILGGIVSLLKNHPWLWLVLIAAVVALIVRAVLRKKARKAAALAAEAAEAARAAAEAAEREKAAAKIADIEAKKEEIVAGLKAKAAAMNWDYEYERIGLYRPQGAVDDTPTIGDVVMFELEPDNPYDPEAVRAMKLGGGKIGYMYRKDKIRGMVTDFIKNEWAIYAEVTKTDPDRLEVSIKMAR